VSERVVVVGGGLAGMTAAIECADRGADVTLLEARRWLGGATSSFVRDGLRVDTGQHVFLRCCTAYRGFLDRLGTTDRTEMQPRMDIPVLSPGWAPARIRRGRLPAPLHLVPALLRYPHLSPGDKLRAARAALAMRRLNPGDPSMDRRTFGHWLAKTGQTPRAVNALWDLFGLPALNVPAAEASLAMAAMVFRTGLLDRNDAADVGVAAAPLSDLHGDPAARALASQNARVHVGARAEAVWTESSGAKGVIADGHRFDADAVILAVPPERAVELLPPGALPDPGRPLGLGSSPIVNVHVVYDRAITRLQFAAVLGSPVQWLFDRTAASGLDRGQYLAISRSGADAVIDRPVEWFRRAFIPALADLFPPARHARVERFLVTRERRATFRQVPGTAVLRPGPVTGVPGLYLAGAWTDTGWPATMEGAVRSGYAASRVALAQIGGRRAGAAA